MATKPTIRLLGDGNYQYIRGLLEKIVLYGDQQSSMQATIAINHLHALPEINEQGCVHKEMLQPLDGSVDYDNDVG